MDHYTCVSGGEFLDVFIPPKPKILNPKPKGDGKKKEPFGPILAFQLFQVIINFLAELTFTFIGADSTRVNTGIYKIKKVPFMFFISYNVYNIKRLEGWCNLNFGTPISQEAIILGM